MDTTKTPVRIPLGSTCEYCGVAEGEEHVDGCPVGEALKAEHAGSESQDSGESKDVTALADSADENAKTALAQFAEAEVPEGLERVPGSYHLQIAEDAVLPVWVWKAPADAEPMQYPYCVTVPGIAGLQCWGTDEAGALALARDEIIAHVALKREAAGELAQVIPPREIEEPDEDEDDEEEPEDRAAPGETTPAPDDWYEVGKVVDVDGAPAVVQFDRFEPGDPRISQTGDAKQAAGEWRKIPLLEVPLDELARTLAMKRRQIDALKERAEKVKDELKSRNKEYEKIAAEIEGRGDKLIQVHLGFGEYDYR